MRLNRQDRITMKVRLRDVRQLSLLGLQADADDDLKALAGLRDDLEGTRDAIDRLLSAMDDAGADETAAEANRQGRARTPAVVLRNPAED